MVSVPANPVPMTRRVSSNDKSASHVPPSGGDGPWARSALANASVDGVLLVEVGKKLKVMMMLL